MADKYSHFSITDPRFRAFVWENFIPEELALLEVARRAVERLGTQAPPGENSALPHVAHIHTTLAKLAVAAGLNPQLMSRAFEAVYDETVRQFGAEFLEHNPTLTGEVPEVKPS